MKKCLLALALCLLLGACASKQDRRDAADGRDGPGTEPPGQALEPTDDFWGQMFTPIPDVSSLFDDLDPSPADSQDEPADGLTPEPSPAAPADETWAGTGLEEELDSFLSGGSLWSFGNITAESAPVAGTQQTGGTNALGEEIDWDSIPPVGDLNTLIPRFQAAIDARQTQIPIVYTGGYLEDDEVLMTLFSLSWIEWKSRDTGGGVTQVLYTIPYYPGTLVADAYLSGDTSGLDAQQMALYNAAVPIVEQALQQGSPLKTELYLHDAVCNATSYYTAEMVEHMPSFTTAYGALVEGRANCQGYTDAFDMLTRMCGMTTGKISGIANGEDHVWNMLQFNGNWYAVDVTHDDEANLLNGTPLTGYIYFNAARDVLCGTHSWDWSLIDPVETIDGTYYYLTAEVDDTHFGRHATDVQSAADYIAQQLVGGAPQVSVMAPRTIGYSDSAAVNARIHDVIDQNYSIQGNLSYSTFFQDCGNYSFVTTYVTGRDQASR